MRKYEIIDVYEDYEILGHADSMDDVRKIAEQRLADTDGECAVMIREYNPKSDRYEICYENKMINELR